VIAADQVAALFEPFRRGVADPPDRPRGFGLGLAIARSVAVVHGGGVSATAFAEGGLEVSVRLPASINRREAR
jgi:signal transduction histidine kinase